MEIDSFLLYLKNIKRYSSHTLVAYKEDLNQFFVYCRDVELINDDLEVTSKMVRRWEAGLMLGGLKLGRVRKSEADEAEVYEALKPMTAKSVRRKLSSVRSYFRYLRREGIITQDPTDMVIVPKIGKKLPVFVPDYLMDDLLDSEKLAGGFPELRDRLVLLMAYYTGMRRSELVGLKLEDVDFASRNIKVNGKGEKQRMIPVMDELLEDMRIYVELREEIVGKKHKVFFVTDKGAPVYDKFIHRLVVRYLGEVTSLSKRSPHVLRHSFATALLNNGACIEAIRELLGHSSLAATQVYTHNSFESLKKIYNQAHPRA